MKSKGRIQILTGVLLLAAALFLTGYNIYLTKSAGEASNSALRDIMYIMQEEETTVKEKGVSAEISGIKDNDETEMIIYPDYVLNPKMPMPVKEIDGKDYVTVLSIPSLDIELPILSEYVYDHLRYAPCRYSGSIYTHDLVICAHNYRSHFGRLKDMSVGDRLTLTDMDGNVFTYEVKEIIVLDPTAIEEFTENGYALTLFTCTYGGASRVTVRCDLVETTD